MRSSRTDPVTPSRAGAARWKAFAGIGALGEELTSPVVASVMFHGAPVDEPRHLEALALDGYLDGPRDAGWHGSADDVRRGYAIAAALRYGLGGMGRWVPVLLDERFHPRAERAFGYPLDEVVTISVAVQRRLAELIPDASSGNPPPARSPVPGQSMPGGFRAP